MKECDLVGADLVAIQRVTACANGKQFAYGPVPDGKVVVRYERLKEAISAALSARFQIITSSILPRNSFTYPLPI